ncbi:MAG: hypothetical protein GXX02_04210 [Syntrophomonadaceae bacterium]|nr:hypothetical protein [Syntrophomonadaceae bacterium]
MRNKSLLLEGIIVAAVIILALMAWLSPGQEMSDFKVACNDDAAGLLVSYLASQDSGALEVVNMSYQQLQDCCNSQTELALAAGNFDMAILCPDSADKLIASGQPYEVLGAVVVNALVLVTSQDKLPQTVGYMNGRDIQKQLVWSNLGSSIEMQPMLPSGLPYALERKAVEGIVLDILGALKIGGYRSALPADYPTSVLVVHKDLIGGPELANFIKAYNQAAAEMNSTEVLTRELAIKLELEDSSAEVEVWKDMGVQYRMLAMPN